MCDVRAPLEHLVLTEKLVLIHRDDSLQSVGSRISHWDKEVREEISTVYVEVEEPFTAGAWRELRLEFPSKSVFHHGDREGFLHILSFVNLAALKFWTCSCLDRHHSRLRAHVETNFHWHNFFLTAFLQIDDVVDTLLHSFLEGVLVDVSENTLRFLVHSSYLVIGHIGDIEAKSLLLHISRQQCIHFDSPDKETKGRWAGLKIHQACLYLA